MKDNQTKCPVCGYIYDLIDVREMDMYYLGDFGCTEENCPTIHVEWKDPGCPKCGGHGFPQESKPEAKHQTQTAERKMPKPIITGCNNTNNRGLPSEELMLKFLHEYVLDIEQRFSIKDVTHEINPQIEGEFFINTGLELHRVGKKSASPSNSIMWKLLCGRYIISKRSDSKIISLKLKGVGQPSEKMVKCMKWITSLFPLRQDLEEYDERIWWDYECAHKFISANFDHAKEEEYRRRQVTKERNFYGHPSRSKGYIPDVEEDTELGDYFGFNPYEFGDQ